MPQPHLTDVHVSTPLTDLSFAYTSEVPTVADKLFPTVPVNSKADTYFTFPKDQWFRAQAKKRAPATESAGSGYELSTDTYSCDVLAIHKDIDDQVRANADSVFNLDAEATRYVTMQLMLKREIDFAAIFFATGVWTGTSTGSDITPGTKWDNASGDPIKDILAQIDAMEEKTGLKPNKMCFGKTAWRITLNNAAVLDRIKYTSSNDNPTMASEVALAKVLGLDQILVAGAVQNTALEGATATMARVYTADQALLVHAAPNPGLMTPTAGYVFSWRRYLAAANSLRIKRFREEKLECDRVEGSMTYAMKRVAADLGCLFVATDT